MNVDYASKLLTAQGEEELKGLLWEVLAEGEEVIAQVYLSLGDAVVGGGVVVECANDVMCKLACSVSEDVRKWARACLTAGGPSESTVHDALETLEKVMEELETTEQDDSLFPSLDDAITETIPMSQNHAVLWHAFHFLAAFPHPRAAATQILLTACHANGYLGPDNPRTHPVASEARRWFLTCLLTHLPSSRLTLDILDKILTAVLPTNLSLLCTFVAQHPALTMERHIRLLFQASEHVTDVFPLAPFSSEATRVGNVTSKLLWSRFDEIKHIPNWLEPGASTFSASVQTTLQQVLKWSDLMAQWYTSVRKGDPPPEPDFELLLPQISSLITGISERWSDLSPETKERLVSSTLPLAALLDANAIGEFLAFTRLKERMPAAYTAAPLNILRLLNEAIDGLASVALRDTDSDVLRVAYILAPQYAKAHATVTGGADVGEVLVETAKRDQRGQQWIGVALRACCAMDGAEQSEYDSDVRLAVFVRAATGILHGVAKGLSPFLDAKYVGEVLQSAQRCMGFWLRMEVPFATVMVAASQIRPDSWAPSVLRCIGSAATEADAEAWAVTVANLAAMGAFSSDDNRKLFMRVISRHPTATAAITRVSRYTTTAERLVAWCNGEEYGTAPVPRQEEEVEELRPQYTLGILDEEEELDEENEENEGSKAPRFQMASGLAVNKEPVRKGKAAYLMDMAARMATPRKKVKKRMDKDLQQVAKLAGASSQAQIEVQPCGAAWVTDNKPKESKPIMLVEDDVIVQAKQFNSAALAAGDMRFKAMLNQSRVENVRQLREKRLPGHKAVLLQAMLQAQVPATLAKRNLPALPVSFVSEDHYAKSLWPYIVEEATAGVQRALDEMKHGVQKDDGAVTEVLFKTEEVVIEFNRMSSNYYSSSEIIAIYIDADGEVGSEGLVLGKVTRYYPRHNQLQVVIAKIYLQSMFINKPVRVSPLTRVGAVFHQNYAINHLAMQPLHKTLLSAEPISTPFKNYQHVVPSGYLAYLGRRFNHVQQTAILKAGSYTEGVSLIQGPPGTGKTHTIVGLLGMLLMRGGPATCPKHKRILVVAPSNTAIDEVALRVATIGLRDHNGDLYKPKMVRVGVRAKVNEKLKPLYLDDIIDLQLGVKRGNADKMQDGYTILRLQIESEARRLKMIENKHSVEYVNQAEKLRLLEGKLKTEAKKRKLAAEAAEESRQMTRAKILDKAHLVFSTLGSCKDLATKFSAVVIDEAAQAVEPDVLVALSCGAKVCVMVGDDKQLPATVLSPRAQSAGYDRSLFARLRHGGHQPLMLSTQYRMHPGIRAFPSKAFYSDKLTDHESLLKRPPMPVLPYFIVNVPKGRTERRGGSNSLCNQVEAKVVCMMVRMLRDATGMSEDDVGVIAPYKDQVDVLRRGLRGIEVNTVDGYQGREKKAIVLSCVRAPGATTGLGFTNKEERVNVSLTRGQSVVVVACHVETMATDTLWRSLIVDARERGVVFEAQSFERGGSLPPAKGELKSEDLKHNKERVYPTICVTAAKKDAERRKKLAAMRPPAPAPVPKQPAPAVRKERCPPPMQRQGVTGGFAASIAVSRKRPLNQPILVGKRPRR